MHITLRSSRARGLWSLRRKANYAAVLEEFKTAARRFGVKIYEMAVVDRKSFPLHSGLRQRGARTGGGLRVRRRFGQRSLVRAESR
jgi:hypothetical protein